MGFVKGEKAMKIVVLGGAGDMGSRAVKDLAKRTEVEELIIADINIALAEKMAKELGKKVKAVYIDANRPDTLIEAMQNKDVVASAMGPFYKYEKVAVKAALTAGVNYVSICDDYDAVESILPLNEKAKEIGCTNTHFVNCNGLPENSHRVLEGQHYSTAKDIALVTFYAYKLPLFADLVSTYEYTVRPGQKGEVVLYNYNKLFLRGYPGADGVKTGMVEASGYCLSASAIREDLRLIAVVLGASSNQERYKDIVSILDYGYNNFKGILLASKSDVIMEIPVHHGKKEKIEIYAQDDLRVTLKKGVDTLPTIDLEIKEYLKAPVKKGECVGVIKAKLGEEIVGEMQAIAGEDVEKATIWLEISRSFLKILGIVKG